MRRRAVSFVLAAFLATGCSSWHARVAPTAGDPTAFAHPIRVTRVDQSVVVLDHAQVSGDSLIGERHATRVAIALRDIQRVDERRISTARTTTLVVGSALGLLVVLAAIAAATIPPNWN